MYILFLFNNQLVPFITMGQDEMGWATVVSIVSSFARVCSTAEFGAAAFVN